MNDNISIPLKLFSLFAVIVFLFILMVIVQCCLGWRISRKNGKNKRKPRRQIGVISTYDEVDTVSHTQHLIHEDHDNSFLAGRQRVPATHVTVTTQNIAASPMVQPPYPVEPRHPTPGSAVHHGIGFATHNPPYPTSTPHPTPAPFYYPPPVGGAPYPPISAPYPPAGGSTQFAEFSAQPPSYSEAVGQPIQPPPVQPPLPAKDGYSKQAPYNPNY